MTSILAERSNIFKTVNNIEVQWVVDNNLRCIFVSDNIYTEYGYTPEEWMRQDVRKNKDYKEILHLTELAAKNVNKNKFYCFNSQIKHRNRTFINVEVTFKAILNDCNELDGFCGTIRNIAQKNELGKKFILNNKSFPTKKGNINFLLSIIAHDLINPYNVILGYTKLLKDNYHTLSEAERISYINKVDSYAYANHKLVKNLLDWSKTQNQGITIKKEILNAENYLKKILDPYICLLEKKELNLIINADSNYVFYADNNLLKIIIVNLFVNAIKFSKPQGMITITLQKNNVHTQIIVEDNGVGMSEAKLNEIFKLSKAKSEFGTEGEKGTGIGLYICKKLIAHHNGTLNFSSVLNKGTKAVVNI